MLTPEQKQDALTIVSVGCDRETAAKYLGCAIETLAESAAWDTAFGRDLLRAEAGAEVAHMRNVQQAARDIKHWRASVWWLERHAPDRYARRDSGAVGRRSIGKFLAELASGVASAIHSEPDRRRVLDQIDRAGARLDAIPMSEPPATDPTDPEEAE